MDEILFEAFNAENRNNKLKAYKKTTVSYSQGITLCKPVFFKNNAILIDKIVMGDIDPSFFNYYRNIEKWYIPKEFQGDIE